MISVYCSECLDGVAAAAIIFRHANLSNLPVVFGGFLHPESLQDELEELAEDSGKLFFVLDVSVSPSHLPLLEKAVQKNQLVYWCAYDENSVVPPVKLFDKARDNLCTAELVQQRFLVNDSVAKSLALLARDVKFWQVQDERALKLSDLIAAQYDPVLLLNALSRGVFWSDQFEKVHAEYFAKKEEAFKVLLGSLHVKSYVNYRFGFARSLAVLSSADACQKILDGHAGVDVAVVLFKDGRFVMRRRDDCDLDLRLLAELFDGGGKSFAAGAHLSQQVTKESMQHVLFKLDQAFRNFFVPTKQV
ncbi:hypothetical protein COV18_01195 [Candidatus Woesearchaeota archaeon CG10_big_fil_rev_8_21_14_0_10_37_12]|nr:MAG: hypothetical protein COV18_01195 [Candidatus Woesearchaeota archaeon CG10_big_fil_rev_8_21_14_0_10_37_12]